MNERKKIHQRKKDSKEYSRKFQGMFEKIPESSRRFDRMSEKILGNVQGNFEEFSKRFRGISKKLRRMLLKISTNVQEGSGDLNMGLFCEILLIFITFCY